MKNDKQFIPGRGVDTLTGDPKKAIIKLSIPMVIAMSVQTIYNLADAIWVSGLGSNGLAAVGFFFPFMMFLIAISTGIAVGAGSAISRAIGARDKEGANLSAMHGLYLAIAMSLFFACLFTLFSRPIFRSMGAGAVLDWAVQYGQIMFMGTVFLFFQSLSSTYLRSEGDAKRAMNVMLLGAVMNILLDPLFIYSFPITLGSTTFRIGLNWGVGGAAIATVVSIFISSIPMFFWLFIKKDTYIAFHFKGFRFKKSIVMDILNVGIPASLSQVSMSIMMFVLTMLITQVNNTDGVAIFTAGWRVVMMAILPCIGISTAVISVCAAAFGAGDYEKLYKAYMYSIRISVIVMAIISSLTYLFAPFISRVFTWSASAANIHDGLIRMNRILCFYYPLVPFSMHTSSMFQGIRKGSISLIITFIRTILFALPFAALFALIFNLGLEGVWYGLTLGNILTGFISIAWGLVYIKRMRLQQAAILQEEAVG